jgi:hypothetical protein
MADYPLIKSPVLRSFVEWLATGLFIAFLVGALKSEAVGLILLGCFLMVAAFAISGIRGAFSRGPWLPVRNAGRIAMFVISILSLVLGLLRLLRR